MLLQALELYIPGSFCSMGTLKIHDLMAKVQDSKTGRTKQQTRSSLPKLLRFDMGSNVSDSHDFLGTVATNVY